MIQRLSELVDVRAGHPFRGSVPVVEGGNAHALQMRDLTSDGLVGWDGLVPTQVDERKRPQWLQPGDVLFVARGTRNQAVCLQQVPVRAVCSPYFFLLRVRSAALLPEFLAWQLNRAPAQRYLAANAEGSDQLSIRRGVLEALPLVVPPLARQRLAVELADAALREKQAFEALTRNRQRQLDALAFELFEHDAPAAAGPQA
ncbi:restriction endonuclease subunit S [Schlegelella sp. S2-27]|uniref:Restriction endonuclease subunit S n=1 Tax=Caldimonas mangrovi TaxID=2944811 RepID=A0ABT0YTZ6_9BURK|nr:restriction endonuclease subunit S [Caldimonas mangrovi]